MSDLGVEGWMAVPFIEAQAPSGSPPGMNGAREQKAGWGSQ